MTDDIASRRPALPGFSRRTVMQLAGAAAASGLFTRGVSAQESSLLWYSGATVSSVDDWARMFEAATGIKVEYFRAGGIKVAQRFDQEVKAGQVKVGPIDTSIPGLMTDWANDGVLMEYESPEAAHYPTELRMPGFWTPLKAMVCCMAYNADIISHDEAPKHWEDLLDPKWKGRMTMSDAAVSGAALHWYGAIRNLLGKEYLEALAKQDILVMAGGAESMETVSTGERPLAAMTLLDNAFQKIDQGVNIYVVFPDEGLPIAYEIIGIAADAPNPDAAKQFVDYVLGREAQMHWQTKFFTPSVRDDIEPIGRDRGRKPLSEVKILSSNAEDQQKLYQQQEELLAEWSLLFK